MRVAGYVRVSTRQQAEQGYSLDGQQREIREECQRHGWNVGTIYVEAGKSGKNTHRPELQALLAAARRRELDKVVVAAHDRAFRSLLDFVQVSTELLSLGITMFAIKERIDTSTVEGRLQLNIMASIAEWERERIRDRIKAGLKEKQLQGELVGTLPLGYIRSDAGNIEQDAVVAPLVREAFTRYATGEYSLLQLARWTREAGLRTREGREHDKMSLQTILTTLSYTGVVAQYRRKGGAVLANGAHPAIVDVATFAQVQEVLSRRRFTPPSAPFGREPYPLSGVAICAYCAKPLVGLGMSRGAKRYMRCQTTHRGGKAACPQPMVSASELEEQIAAYIADMRLSPEYLDEVVAELRRMTQPPAGEGEANQLRRALDRLKDLFTWGELEQGEFRQKTSSIRKRLADLEMPREVLDVERAVKLLQNIGEVWHDSPRGQQREFVHRVFSRIRVRGPQILALTANPEYDPLFRLDRTVRFGGVCSLVGATGFEPATS